ncbi:MAG: YbhB/YbcL family Raf kinase inhibitor-like protein [Candidatus Kerfeldbacteria bacterium]|nr:YbhB/YbcL family Raf kinase inhibitor-like protein [Candidatus Kerfeldbacteria bacterium]
MRLGFILIATAIVIVFVSWLTAKRDTSEPTLNTNAPATVVVTSSAFTNNGNVPAKYTCDGQNTSPPLQISGQPANAKGLALIMDDPDAPGRTYTHWLVWNIPPQTSTVSEGQSPSGATGQNSAGQSIYTGPCPPSGTHRYYFRVYALDAELTLAAGSSKSDVVNAMSGHVLTQGELIGRYRRQ